MTKEELKVKLKRLGWSQAELASRIGSYPATISRYDKVPGAVEAYINLALERRDMPSGATELTLGGKTYLIYEKPRPGYSGITGGVEMFLGENYKT